MNAYKENENVSPLKIRSHADLKSNLNSHNAAMIDTVIRLPKQKKQEVHGLRFAHLSDIATADMQMLCNIFPILSLQLMKISSFEQFLVLKKNIWT